MTKETNSKRKQTKNKSQRENTNQQNSQTFTDKERKAESVAKQIRGGFE